MAKPTLHATTGPEGTSLIARGDLAIQHAGELKNLFLESMNWQGNTRLDLNEVTALDVAGIQLTYLWKLGMQQLGCKVTIAWPQNESLRDLLEKCGITKLL